MRISLQERSRESGVKEPSGHVRRRGRGHGGGTAATHVTNVNVFEARRLDPRPTRRRAAFEWPRTRRGRWRGPASGPGGARRRRRSAPAPGCAEGPRDGRAMVNVKTSRNVFALSSSSGSARISLPVCSRATWLATRSTSPIWWLESSTVRPVLARSTMLSRNSRRTIASRPDVGSSRIRSGGVRRQGQRQRDLGPHPLGQGLDLPLERAGRSRRSARRTASDRPPRPCGLGVEAGGEPADLGDGHPVVQGRRLGHVADPAADLQTLPRGSSPSTCAVPPSGDRRPSRI